MQSPTSATIRGLSIIFFLSFLSITLTAQVKIHERIDIAPKESILSHTNSTSNGFPCFTGEIDPTFYWETITVMRPCMVTATGTMSCEVPVNLYPNVNGTVTFFADCGSIDFGAEGALLSCGGIILCNTTGNISDNSANFDIQGTWCCLYPDTHPIHFTFSISAIPWGKDPSTIAMNAMRTSFDARMDGMDNLCTVLSPTLCDESGIPFCYCGPTSMVVTIENPINGTYFTDDLLETSLGTSLTIEKGGHVLFYWDGSDLPNGLDSVDISIGAECLGFSGTQKIQLKKFIPPCLEVKIPKKEISPGDTVAVSIMAMKNGTEQSYPPDEMFSVWMNADAKYGKLRCTGDSGSYVFGRQPFEFIAADSIDVDSIVVEIGAMEGGGGADAIGVGKDTLHSHGSILANVQTKAKIIGAAPNEMKRKNIELSMNTLQARLNKVSARKGNEKQQQKLALDIEKLKAQLAYETAKTPAEKQSSLAKIKQIAMIASVQEVCNSADTVTIKKPVLKIVDHSPWTIWPYLPPQNSDGASRGADRPGYNPKRTFTIQLLKGDGAPFPNQQISIFTKYKEGSGGHGHTGYADTGGTIPAVKSLKPDTLKGLFYYKGEKTGKNPLTVTTEADGTAKVDSFIASQASGKFLVTARMKSDTTIMDTVNLQVKVDGFVQFVIGSYWRLTGNTSNQGRNHPSNHWCTQKTKDSLEAVLKKFYDWTASEEGEGEAIKLGINDMCLQWDGAFDISGTWQFNDYHSFHRVGLSVDIDNAGLKEADPENAKKKKLTDRGQKLEKIMNGFGGRIYDEGPIHFGFNQGN